MFLAIRFFTTNCSLFPSPPKTREERRAPAHACVRPYAALLTGGPIVTQVWLITPQSYSARLYRVRLNGSFLACHGGHRYETLPLMLSLIDSTLSSILRVIRFGPAGVKRIETKLLGVREDAVNNQQHCKHDENS